ncbi:YciI family protein [Labrys neptuniae]
MLFVVQCEDIPNGLDLRLATRQAHLDYLKTQEAFIRAAGPFLDEQERMVGSMLVVDFPTEAEARTFAANDPYAKAGLFASTTIRRWRWSVKPPAGL